MKIHRNSVFVVERLNFIDGIWNLAMKPSDIVLSTKAGHKATKIAKPYVAYVGELAKPAVFSAQLAIGAVKASVNAGLSGGEGGEERRKAEAKDERSIATTVYCILL